MQITSEKIIHTDVLIIGGGTAGCYAALTLRSLSDASVIIAEKADIRRSGCLAAGVNALNAYITKGHTPQFYVDYAKKDAAGIVREDLLLTMSEGLNEVTRKLEDLGLVILKDEKGEYVARGTRNIKINGENIKTILAAIDFSKKLIYNRHIPKTEGAYECRDHRGAEGSAANRRSIPSARTGAGAERRSC